MGLKLTKGFLKVLFTCILLYPTLSSAKNISIKDIGSTHIVQATKYSAGVMYWSSITPAVLFVLFIVVLAIGIIRYYWTNRNSRDISAD